MLYLNKNIVDIGVSLSVGIPLGLTLSKYIIGNKYTKFRIKQGVIDILRKNKLQNENGKIPKIFNINISDYGFSFDLDCKGVCSYTDIQNIKEYITTYYHAISTEIGYSKITTVNVLLNKIEQINYKYQELNPYTLLCGYTPIGEPITINMKKTPHVGVVGTSTSGKSKCVELMLTNLRNADITLVNAFEDDFKNIKCNRVNGNRKIVEFLKNNTNCKYKLPRPHYIVIDEYNVLNNIKGIDKMIQDLLSQARHFNIYVICIMQIGNKEDCRFKNLFNTRIAFRTLEQQTLSAFLGISETLPLLPDREFYMTSTKLFKGKTYNLFL